MKTFLTLVLALMSATVVRADAVTAADKGKTITVKAGQEIVISLKGNPTTGYSWDWAGVQGDSVVTDGKVKYQSDDHSSGMVGVSGMFTAKLKAVKPGKSTVRLEYRRPWEKDAKPREEDVFAVTLSVEK